jgi:hypothetical protein
MTNIIKFNVKFNNENKIVTCEDTDTIIILKKKIIQDFKLIVKYIDLEFLNEIPIRYMGKFNLEKGKMPRTFDKYLLNRWELVNKEIPCTFIQIYDYNPNIKKPIKKKNINTSIYKLPSKVDTIKSGDEYIQKKPTYDLNSSHDFPTL